MTEKPAGDCLFSCTITLPDADVKEWSFEINRYPTLRKQWALWLTRDDQCQPLAYFRTKHLAEAAAGLLRVLATGHRDEEEAGR